MELIKAWIYNPATSIVGTKSDNALGYTAHCQCPNKCDAYKQNKCLLVNLDSCCYGKLTVAKGYTQRSSKYDEWINSFIEKNKTENKKTLDGVYHTEYIGDDAVFLNLHYLKLNDKFFKEQSEYILSGTPGFFGNSIYIVKREFLTAENVYNYIISFNPIAINGKVIKCYQDKIVPNFLMDLNIICPELITELKQKYDLSNYDFENYVDKLAYVTTLLPGHVMINNKKWYWDGEFLTTDEMVSCFIANGHYSSIQLKPTDKCIVNITNNNQVSKDTKFK